MKGWLIVNSFFEKAKFLEIYSLLTQAAKRREVELELIKGYELAHVMGEPLKREAPDFVLYWDKDITLARALEDMGLRLFNTAEAILDCDDKARTCYKLARHGVTIPRTVAAPKTFEGLGYTNLDFLKNAINTLGLPMVIKESYGSFGQQVYLARTEAEAEEIVKGIGHKEFIMQELIAESYGRDIRINVVGDRAVASMMRYNDNDFRSNITNGGSMMRYEPTEAQKAMAVAAVKALDLDFAGVDVLFGKEGEPVICEVNSNPHFKTTLECTGIDLADHIIDYVIGKIEC